jgi:hypothetical protein
MREHSRHFWLRVLGNIAVFVALGAALGLIYLVLREGARIGGLLP